jgi:O-antigen ligase
VLGFLAFTGMTSEFEFGMFTNPAVGIVFVVIGLACLGIVRRMRREMIDIDQQIIFEDTAAAQFEFLRLSDGG